MSDEDKKEEKKPAGKEKAGLVTDPAKLKQIVMETNEILARMQARRGVIGIIISNTDGSPIRDTFKPEQRLYVYRLSQYMHQFNIRATESLRVFDEKNPVLMFRIRSKLNEILVIPDPDYYLIVVQDPTER